MSVFRILGNISLMMLVKPVIVCVCVCMHVDSHKLPLARSSHSSSSGLLAAGRWGGGTSSHDEQK